MVRMIILTIVSLLTMSVNSQELIYDSDGVPTGILLTIEEAQKVDSDYDILRIYKSLNVEYVELESLYISIVNNLNDEIELMQFNIDLLNEQLRDINTVNSMLLQQNNIHKENVLLYEEQLRLNDDVVKGLSKDLKQQRTIKWISVATMIISGILYLTK